MSFTAQEVTDKISALDEKREEENESRYGYYGIYEELHDGSEVEVDGLGKVESVESFGGEGQGDDYWVVFKVGDQFFRKNGWYASYDGGYLDGDLYEVVPEQVTRTEYKMK